MLENLPRITEEQVLNQDGIMLDTANKGAITKWLDEHLRFLSKENPVLYRFIMARSQRYVMQAQTQSPQDMQISLAIEILWLLMILGNSLEGERELSKFEKDWGRAIGDIDLSGLPD